ncbi:MAG TPA: ABC transporter ATP-binding protein [Actinomycetales bacterium]|nr:ABC transporter ATP-binding protein [Actinomycetales bacterium]
MNDALLQLQDLTLRYGSLTAVDGVTLAVREGARHALIGPNGAGKSSLFSVVAGHTPATSGRVVFNGQDVTGLGEAGRARAGLVRTFQHSSLFLGMSVLDNAKLAVERAQGRPKRPWPSPRADRAIRDEAMQHLKSVGLLDRRSALTGALSHGERRQLEVGMVLACQPRLVLFDEPTAGMSVAETTRFAELVESLPKEVTVVVVEHDLDVVFRLAERVSVLAAGKLIADGTPEEVRADEKVREAYLGRPRSSGPLFGVAS